MHIKQGMTRAHLMPPMSEPPSEPPDASVTMPKGASGSVVPGTLDQCLRHRSTIATCVGGAHTRYLHRLPQSIYLLRNAICFYVYIK